MLIHLGTRINVMFAEVDAMGNAVNKTPLSYEVETLDEAGFGKAYQSMLHDRAVLALNVKPPLEGEKATAEAAPVEAEPLPDIPESHE